MKIKPGVELSGIQSPIVYAIYISNKIHAQHGIELTITSGLEGVHIPESLHYKGMAFDSRIGGIKPDVVKSIADKIRKRLGKKYDVVLSATNLHIEYDPK